MGPERVVNNPENKPSCGAEAVELNTEVPGCRILSLPEKPTTPSLPFFPEVSLPGSRTCSEPTTGPRSPGFRMFEPLLVEALPSPFSLALELAPEREAEEPLGSIFSSTSALCVSDVRYHMFVPRVRSTGALFPVCQPSCRVL